ncbi:alpha/beta hydrolase [Cupriavidus necator]|uniref:alpha/beta hydrolase n=1 Tax=Cupriavidus necator TaxID=106590 RepID=UPI0039C0588D
MRCTRHCGLPRTRLRFPGVMAASRHDTLGRLGRVAQLADHRGSRLVEPGNVGHLNTASGFGPWPAAKELLRELL